jgi:hypothetical protein
MLFGDNGMSLHEGKVDVKMEETVYIAYLREGEEACLAL